MRIATKVTEAISCASGAFMPSSRPASAAGITPVSRVQHMNSISLQFPARAAVGQGACEHGDRPRHQHQHGDDGRASEPVLPHQGEIDLRAEQDEDEDAHDERRGQHELVELLRFARLHAEAERLLVAEHDAEHEHRHEAGGVQAARAEIGADHGDQRHHRRIFGEERPSLMRDQRARQTARAQVRPGCRTGIARRSPSGHVRARICRCRSRPPAPKTSGSRPSRR